MSTRLLSACAVAVLILLALTALAYLTRHSLGGWMTPVGLVEPLNLVAIAIAMAVGGAIARRGFRWPAVGLVIVVGLASAIAAFGFAPPQADGAARWLARNTLLPLMLSAVVAWLSAMLGERLASHRFDREAVSDGE